MSQPDVSPIMSIVSIDTKNVTAASQKLFKNVSYNGLVPHFIHKPESDFNPYLSSGLLK